METVIAVEDLKTTYQPQTRKGVEVKAIEVISFEVPLTWLGLRRFEKRALD